MNKYLTVRELVEILCYMDPDSNVAFLDTNEESGVQTAIPVTKAIRTLVERSQYIDPDGTYYIINMNKDAALARGAENITLLS
jgi:hypothetical protein